MAPVPWARHAVRRGREPLAQQVRALECGVWGCHAGAAGPRARGQTPLLPPLAAQGAPAALTENVPSPCSTGFESAGGTDRGYVQSSRRRDHGPLPTRRQYTPQEKSHLRVGWVSVGSAAVRGGSCRGAGAGAPQRPRGLGGPWRRQTSPAPPVQSRADYSSQDASGGRTTLPGMLHDARGGEELDVRGSGGRGRGSAGSPDPRAAARPR